MDYRETLRIPDKFAYIMGTGGVDLRHNEFQISFAISVAELTAIGLVGHTNCGMVNLMAKKRNSLMD